MFDAKSILDALVRGGAQQQQAPQGGSSGGLGDLLEQLTQGQAKGQQPGSGGGGSLGDLLGQLINGQAGSQQPGLERSAAPAGSAPQGGGGGLSDLLGKLQQQAGQGGGGLGDLLGKLQQQAGQGTGGLADILGQVFGQATTGVREGAGRLDQATGASGQARDAIGQMTGRSPEELMAQLKELLASNKLGAGAALGGLGALVLGTGAGRSLAGSAVKLGALALIGGLAYKAYQNYQQGQPVLSGNKPQQALVAAPEGSGFEADAVTNDQATLYLRAMIAAAASDGRIDAAEQKNILGALGQGGVDKAAQQFIAKEINNPASAEELASDVKTPEQALQVYTAARLSVDVDTNEEHAFLAELAERLGIDGKLAAHIDAVARGTA